MSTLIMTSEQYVQNTVISIITGIALGDNLLKLTLRDVLDIVESKTELKGIEESALKSLIKTIINESPEKLVDSYLEDIDNLSIPVSAEDFKGIAREIRPNTFELDPDLNFLHVWLENRKRRAKVE